MSKKIILTGDRPTGKLHLGHFVGSLRERINIQNSNDYDEMYIMIADAQALTDNADNPNKIRENIIEVALDYLSVGLNPEKVTLFIQSQVPELTELTFFYMNLVTVSRLERNPTVKSEISQKKELFGANGESITYGFLGYPVSQAADITAFHGELVPVGDDQLPLLEQCREIVRKFNSIYGETLVEPEQVLSSTTRVKGLDGNEKMGKSLGNAIYLVDDAETIHKKVMGAVTDPKKIRKDEPANPDICMVYYYHQLVSPKKQVEKVCQECKLGSRGCVQCKKELIAAMNLFLMPIQERRKYYEQHPEIVQKILDEGTEKARKKASEQMKKVKHAMKIDY